MWLLYAGNEDGTAPERLPAATSCALCGGEPELPHLNCANIDCNKLFLACPACKVNSLASHPPLWHALCLSSSPLRIPGSLTTRAVEQLGGMAEPVHNAVSLHTCHSSPVSLPQEKHSGCCCEACISAPRLVRRANGGGNYARWLDCATEDLQDAGSSETRAQVSTSLGCQHMRPGLSLVFVPCKDAELVSTLAIGPLRRFNAHQHDEAVLCAQRALRQQQAALAKRIAEGRSDGRSRRRVLRKERLVERMREEREEHTRRRQMVKVCATSRRILSVHAAAVLLTCSHVLLILGAAAQNNKVTV